MPLGDIMKSKLYLIIFLAVASGMPMPAQAGLWSSFRNSAIITTLFGKPAEINYTAQTRLPVVEVKPSFWARMFNLYSWMNFRKSAQPEAAPAPEPAQPILSPEAAARFNNQLDRLRNECMQPEPILSPEAAQNLADRLNAMRKEYWDNKEAVAKEDAKIDNELRELRTNNTNYARQVANFSQIKELLAQAEKEKELARSAAQKEAREQIETLNKTISTLTQEISSLNVKSCSSIADLNEKKAELERKGIEYLEALNEKTQLLKQMQQSTSIEIAEAKETNTKLIQKLESAHAQEIVKMQKG